jgi:hypothetical protein
MKTTLNIPDELYREVKAKSALEGRAVRDVTVELYSTWVGRKGGSASRPTSEQWLEEWVQMGGSASKNRLPNRTATQVLSEDRGRLDRR